MDFITTAGSTTSSIWLLPLSLQTSRKPSSINLFYEQVKWFQKQGFSFLHSQLLTDVGIRSLRLAVIDSMALRSGLYDFQEKWGISTWYHWFKGY
jgi:hypothetical protein